MFNHELNITDSLLMHRVILNIQGLNEESNGFHAKINNDGVANKERSDGNYEPAVLQLAGDNNKITVKERLGWILLVNVRQSVNSMRQLRRWH